MINAIWRSASGMRAQQLVVDGLANDAANINTIAYKGSRVGFAELVYRAVREGGMPVDRPAVSILTPSLGAGVKIASMDKDFSQGAMLDTGESLHLFIQGEGFFAVTGPDGQWFLTRDGSFQLDHEGEIVNAGGYRLTVPFNIPPEAEKVVVGSDGTVRAVIEGEDQILGEIYLFSVPNPAGLEAVGGNLYRETEASGRAVMGVPGTQGFGTLRAGFLEGSNVELAVLMTKMVLAQRAYELNSRSIKVSDEMWGIANHLRV